VLAQIGPEHPDGIKVDSDGRIYASSPTGIQVLDPTGRLLGEIRLPGAVNFAFARNLLLITADTAVWAAVLHARGG
jgi:gluconolactonase